MERSVRRMVFSQGSRAESRSPAHFRWGRVEVDLGMVLTQPGNGVPDSTEIPVARAGRLPTRCKGRRPGRSRGRIEEPRGDERASDFYGIPRKGQFLEAFKEVLSHN